ncbi:O-methyltransferase involved in polyketide biosynthesis [Kitasatospora sp. MAP12-15]|uniref:SAM-dependent methyltransferase n=1 Tax=unclassified Kitasatospora TaxID=2633591 RepID=UPI00247486A0|nr:SAM-dependent methyltransferase [Kitasatospora sp. MAP12-44]MDH6113848.1 O-methyltransferase involved in polyketide biosynthesis [Kitasatospora sp. MAP12-44]
MHDDTVRDGVVQDDWLWANTDDWEPPAELDTDIAHPARMYDYYLGGKDNFPADREAAEKIIAAVPFARLGARLNRQFLGRAVTFAAERGVRQFLDIGTGIPAVGSTSEVAHRVAPDARVVYVDNDPIVLTHARALLANHPAGHTTVIQADLRDPATILADPGLLAAIDLAQPVALMLVAVLHFIQDEEATRVVSQLRDALAPGSLLILSHGSQDFMEPATVRASTGIYSKASAPLVLRDRAQIADFFTGFDLVEPGLVQLPLWRAEQSQLPADWHHVSGYAGVAVKP